MVLVFTSLFEDYLIRGVVYLILGSITTNQDFYFDLADDGHKISPRDYLESALQPVPGTGKAAAAKNEVLVFYAPCFCEIDECVF